eukprot:gene12242-16407_t
MKSISAEKYFRTGVLVFICTIITGAIVTYKFSNVDYDHNPLIKWYGYNNVCIVFDTPPATYVMPVCFALTGFFMVLYAVEDYKRIWRLPHLTSICKICSQVTDVLVAFVGLFLSVFNIKPGANMVAHTTAFLSLIIALPLIYIVHCWQSPKRSPVYIISVVLYALLSATKASFTLVALITKRHLPSTLAQFIDGIWLLAALPAPFLMPPPPDPKFADKVEAAKTKAFYAGAHATPLILLLVPVVVISVMIDIVVAICKRIYGKLYNPTPSPGKYSQASISPTREEESGIRRCPLRCNGEYVGDIFGYISILTGGLHGFGKLIERVGTTVFGVNYGTAMVACFDVSSVDYIFKPYDETNYGYEDYLVNFSMFTTMVVQKGKDIFDTRGVILSLLPKSSNDESFKTSMECVRNELRQMVHLDEYDLQSTPLDEYASRLIHAFACGALLGETISYDLFDDFYPVPFALPKYPYIPKLLLPQYYSMRSAISSIIDIMKTSPRWSEIQQLLQKSNLNENEFAQRMVTILTVNITGAKAAIMNIFMLLPQIISLMGLNNFIDNNELLDSFCWEILRFSGVFFNMISNEEVDITTSKGDIYTIQAGTKLFTHTGYVCKDETVWSDPQVFKPDRFIHSSRDLSQRTTEGIEPLPTLVMGCPLGHIDRTEDFRKSHQCPALLIIHSYYVELTKILTKEFRWDLDSKTLKITRELVLPHKDRNQGTVPHFDFNNSIFRKTFGFNDHIIDIPNGQPILQFIKSVVKE